MKGFTHTTDHIPKRIEHVENIYSLQERECNIENDRSYRSNRSCFCLICPQAVERCEQLLREVNNDRPVIITFLRNVPNPRQSLISTLLDNLEIADLDARYGEVRNLKLDCNRCFAFRCVVCRPQICNELSETATGMSGPTAFHTW